MTDQTIQANDTMANRVAAIQAMPDIDHPDRVRTLPWYGNAYSDMPLFELIERSVRRMADRGDREMARRTLDEMVRVGMGCDDPPTTEEQLAEFLAE